MMCMQMTTDGLNLPSMVVPDFPLQAPI